MSDRAARHLKTYLVSAERTEGCTRRVRITAEHGGRLRLRNPFAAGKPRWNRRGVIRAGDNYECELCAGETLEGKLPGKGGGIQKGKPWKIE